MSIVTLFLLKKIYISEKVYQHPRPLDMDTLKEKIRHVWENDITPDMLTNAGHHFLDCIRRCERKEGGHIEH